MTENNNENQMKIVPDKLEFAFDGVPVRCAPEGSFNDDKGKLITYPNRVKIGNGFKTIADFRSIDQLNAVIKLLRSKKANQWIKDNLPQTTTDTDSEVEESS